MRLLSQKLKAPEMEESKFLCITKHFKICSPYFCHVLSINVSLNFQTKLLSFQLF